MRLAFLIVFAMVLLLITYRYLAHAGDKTLSTTESTMLNADERPQNAALQYWLAFAIMPMGSLEDFRKIEGATTDNPALGFAVPVRRELEHFFSRPPGREALDRLHRASHFSHCTWGSDLRADGSPPVPYAEKAHQLARLSLLRARWRFEHAEWNDGVDDVIATMVMARHIGRDRVWPTIHFGVMIESMSVVTAAVYLPRMPAETRVWLAGKLASLPPFTTMEEVCRASEKSIDWFVSMVGQAEKQGRLREAIARLSSPSEAGAILGETHDAAGLIKSAQGLRPLLNEGADLLVLSVDDFRRAYKRTNLGSRLKSNLVGRLLIPPLDGECDEQAVGRVRLALLKAGIDVIDRGRAALKEHPDPCGHSLFKHFAFDGGFELVSHLSVPAGSPMCQSIDFGLRQNGPKVEHPCR
jgi:hypothetical protein